MTTNNKAVCWVITALSMLVVVTGSRVKAQENVRPEISTPELQLQQRLTKACEDNKLPAIWAGRFRADGTKVAAVAGVREWGEAEAAELNDIVHLGSCTKAMAAVIVGQLCSEGKLTLGAILEEVLPDVKELQSSEVGKITVHQLLQHRSGVMANTNYHHFDQTSPESAMEARRQLLTWLCDQKLAGVGEFRYSNIGYTVLGHIAETIEKETWEALAKRRIFDRLGMTSASFGPVGIPDESNGETLVHRASGHVEPSGLSAFASLLSKEKSEPFSAVHLDNSRCMSPAGRAHMNLDDWSKFVILYCKADSHSKLGISKDVWDEFLRMPETENKHQKYMSGWIAYDSPAFQGKGLFHNGSNTSWYCYALASSERQQCVLVAINAASESAQKIADEIAREQMAQ